MVNTHQQPGPLRKKYSNMINLVSILIVSTAAFFIAWVVFSSFVLDHVRHHKGHILPVQILILFFGMLFLIGDSVYNIIFGTIYFRRLPEDWTLSQRLIRMLHDEPVESWRWSHSYYICRKLISPWDFNHCGLGLGR